MTAPTPAPRKTAHPAVHPIALDWKNGGHICALCGAPFADGLVVYSELNDDQTELIGVEAVLRPMGLPGVERAPEQVMHACGSMVKGSV